MFVRAVALSSCRGRSSRFGMGECSGRFVGDVIGKVFLGEPGDFLGSCGFGIESHVEGEARQIHVDLAIENGFNAAFVVPLGGACDGGHAEMVKDFFALFWCEIGYVHGLSGERRSAGVA